MENKIRFKILGWTILEAKYLYYCSPNHPRAMSDARYDSLEKEYISLAAKLGKAPTASNMVGFNIDRPSCQLVKKKICNNGRNFRFINKKENE